MPLVAGVLACGPTIRADEGWDWVVVPYLWASSAGLDVEVNNDPVLGADASFSDLIDDVDLAGMIHFEGRTGKAGFFADAVYFSLSDSKTTPPNPPLLPDGAAVDAALTLGRYEGAGFFRIRGETEGLDLFLGVRVIDLDQQADFIRTTPTPASRSLSGADTLLDGFLGARFSMPFAKRFWFNVRGDIGTGGTQLSWTANAGVGVWFGEGRKYGLELAYEHFAFEVEDVGDLVDVESEIELSGPLVGFVFRF